MAVYATRPHSTQKTIVLLFAPWKRAQNQYASSVFTMGGSHDVLLSVFKTPRSPHTQFKISVLKIPPRSHLTKKLEYVATTSPPHNDRTNLPRLLCLSAPILPLSVKYRVFSSLLRVFQGYPPEKGRYPRN